MLNNVINLKSIGYFSAPEHRVVNSYPVPDNVECVEVLTSGKVYFSVNGKEQEYTRGTVFWHLSGENTIWKTDPEAPYCCIFFYYLVKNKIRVAPKVSCWQVANEAAEYSEKCLKQFHAGVDNMALFTTYTYSTLAWNALSQNAEMTLPAVLLEAIEFIDSHWHEAIDTDEIAKKCDVSKSYLFRLFQKHLSCGPYQYVLSQRIGNAKLLLANKDLSIKKISSECGFLNIEVFYRQFKKMVKTSPAEYRNTVLPYHYK